MMGALRILLAGLILSLSAMAGAAKTPGGDFTLHSIKGEPVSLSSMQGKVVLLFFGYTTCPDVCPVTLTEFRQVKQALGEQAGKVRFVLVTVDPERDTPQKLGTYVEQFDPAFTGLTGSQEALQKVYQDYGVYVAKVDSHTSAGYLVDHTARVYAVDKQGNLRLTYPFGMDVAKMSEDVAHLLAEK